jgi:agmatinase
MTDDHRTHAFLEGPAPQYEDAAVVILPVPLESTVSYGAGTSRGPAAIIEASTQVELYDEGLESEPHRAGLWTSPALPLPAGGNEAAVDAIERRIGSLLDDGKWVVMLGGEHAITPGGVRAAAARHDGLTVVQLDAHADLREAYEGDRHSHACAMARSLEHAEVRAVGIRSYSAGEAARMRERIPGYRVVHARDMDDAGAWHDEVLDGIDGRPVYLTIDVDYFDPAIIPATGTPEPGGGTWDPTVRFFDALFRRANVVAADVVELAPIPGLHHADFTAARLVYRLIGLQVRGRS